MSNRTQETTEKHPTGQSWDSSNINKDTQVRNSEIHLSTSWNITNAMDWNVPNYQMSLNP